LPDGAGAIVDSSWDSPEALEYRRRSTEVEMANDPSSVTNLSTRTVVLLMVFGPLLALVILVGISYAITPW
jgi:hypothetical protein